MRTSNYIFIAIIQYLIQVDSLWLQFRQGNFPSRIMSKTVRDAKQSVLSNMHILKITPCPSHFICAVMKVCLLAHSCRCNVGILAMALGKCFSSQVTTKFAVRGQLRSVRQLDDNSATTLIVEQAYDTNIYIRY